MFHTKERDKTSEKGLNEVEKAFYLIIISFMNTFNKLLVNQIEQNKKIRYNLHRDFVWYFPGMQEWLNILKSINYINRAKGEK